jgi:Spy/CpxP family protein refolding chaperone
MKTLAKRLVAVIAAVVIALSPALVYAEHADKECETGDEVEQAKGHGGFYKDLGLTPQQTSELKARREANAGKAKEVRDELKAKRAELKAEIEKPTVDRARITALTTDIKGLTGQMIDQRVDNILAMKEILTPEQFSKMQAKMHAKKGGKGNWKGKDKGHGMDF